MSHNHMLAGVPPQHRHAPTLVNNNNTNQQHNIVNVTNHIDNPGNSVQHHHQQPQQPQQPQPQQINRHNHRAALPAQIRGPTNSPFQQPQQQSQQQHQHQPRSQTSNQAPQMHHSMMQSTGLHHNQLHHNHHQNMNSSAASSSGGGAYMKQSLQDSDYPLRMLVQSDMVGAIIGRSGSTIKLITQQSKARIDVHREESLDQQEKIITINGSPESCSAACFKIIEIILNERHHAQKNDNHNNLDDLSSANHEGFDPQSEVHLRILAHNNLIGRLIGRSGATIKKIMERTSTKINISVNSLADCTSERIITVVGDLEQVRQAEQVISAKLRAAYLSDMSLTMHQALHQQPYLFNNVLISYMPGPYTQNPILTSLVNPQAGHGGHPMSRAMPVGSHQSQITGHALYPNPPNYMPIYPNINAGHGLLGFNPAATGLDPTEKEVVNIYIPSSMVGAIIGKSGSAIKEMISTSGASIKVAAAPIQPETSSPISKPEGEAVTSQKQQPANEEQQEPQTQDSQQEQEPQTVHEPQQKHELQPEQTLQDELTKSDTENDSKPEEAQTDATSDETVVIASPPQQVPNRQLHGSSDHYASTRKVTIVGTPESQWSAQYLIYRKISFENGKSDVSLMVEIQVPSQLVGKIIGKGGATVKQIQKQTRTIIRLPDDKTTDRQIDTEKNDSETSVQITGEFQNSQIAQRHIKNLIREEF